MGARTHTRVHTLCMCVLACMCIFDRFHAFLRKTFVNTNTVHMHPCLSVCLSVFMYVRMYVCIRVCKCTQSHIYTHLVQRHPSVREVHRIPNIQLAKSNLALSRDTKTDIHTILAIKGPTPHRCHMEYCSWQHCFPSPYNNGCRTEGGGGG